MHALSECTLIYTEIPPKSLWAAGECLWAMGQCLRECLGRSVISYICYKLIYRIDLWWFKDTLNGLFDFHSVDAYFICCDKHSNNNNNHNHNYNPPLCKFCSLSVKKHFLCVNYHCLSGCETYCQPAQSVIAPSICKHMTRLQRLQNKRKLS
jgi:hypothetical protein